MLFNPSRKLAKILGRVDFFPEEFRARIQSHGLDIYWEMASECPCMRPSAGMGLVLDAGLGTNEGTTRQARADCPKCKGTGYRHHSGQNIKGQVTGATQHPDRFRTYGEMATGMISLTVNAEHRLNRGDRITLRDDPALPETAAPVQLYRETHTYEGEVASATRYPVYTRTLDTTPPMDLGVVDLYVSDADGIAQPGGERVAGVDFTVDGDGKIQWINPPVAGARWSISYYGRPVYLVVDLPHPFRDTKIQLKHPAQQFTSLPINAMCALEFLATGLQTG